MGRCLVQLATDRRLLHHEFEGYRLAGADAACGDVVRTPLPGGALRAPTPPEGRSSLLHTRLYALHNALVHDPFHPSATYFLADSTIWRADNSGIKTVSNLQIEQGTHPHPCTLMFCDEDRAVFADGSKHLTVYSTGNRKNEDPPKWKTIASIEVPIQNGGFSILDVRLDVENNLQCLLYEIEQEQERCVAIVDWVVLENRNESWNARIHRQIRSPGVVHYCALEPGCEAIYIAADRPADFVDKPKPEIPEPTIIDKTILYSWIQNSEDVTVIINLPKKVTPIVDSTRDSLNVRCGTETLVDGKLFDLVDQEVTTWNIDGSGKLNVCMSKRNTGSVWPSLLKDGDPDGEQVPDLSYVAEVHSRLAHLCSENEAVPGENLPLFNSQQLEECDFSSEEESCLCNYIVIVIFNKFLSILIIMFILFSEIRRKKLCSHPPSFSQFSSLYIKRKHRSFEGTVART